MSHRAKHSRSEDRHFLEVAIPREWEQTGPEHRVRKDLRPSLLVTTHELCDLELVTHTHTRMYMDYTTLQRERGKVGKVDYIYCISIHSQ